MFRWLGASVGRRPWPWVVGWATLAVLLGLVSPSRERLAAIEPASLMPPDQPHNVALDLEGRAFPELASRTRTVLVFERADGLTPGDQTYLAELTQRLQRVAAEGPGWRVQSPVTQPYLRSRLLSRDGEAAIIVVHSDANYVTHRCHVEVQRIESLARAALPAGLTLEVTGEGGMGRDLSEASTAAYRRTTWVTVTALLVILALVYRSPLAALVPLVTVAVSVYVAIAALNLLALTGWGISDLERTFVVVLLFGSGVDFSLFWMWRYREELSGHLPREQGFMAALCATGPAIATSAATTIFGFLMLMSADLRPSHNAGRALGIALAIALAAAVTLVPAVARLMGGALFWPRRLRGPDQATGGGLWAAAAELVTRRPATVLVVILLLLAGPVWAGLRVQVQYDALGVVPKGSSSARGRHLAERHFGTSQVFSWTCLVEKPGLARDAEAAEQYAGRLAELCARVPGVTDVWSLAAPLGRQPDGHLLQSMVATVARPYYLGHDPECLRLELMLDAPPLSRAAMGTCRRVLDQARRWTADNLGDIASVHATGLTPYILNIKAIAEADQRRIMVLVVAAIALIVLIWVRRLALTACMVLATLAVYAATLGAAEVFSVHVLGADGIDWKVRLFVFVVLVAVGQDYNIFVVSRMRQECRERRPLEAVRTAILRTGSVISSCGLIMAATLSSLAATGLSLLQQLGFAFAFGVLLDTFVVRPLLVPACYLLLHRLREPRTPEAQTEPD